MADLKTTAEERAFAVQCRSCFGRGMRDPTCFRCDDSTEDHECPPEVTCGACKGSGDNPEVRRILDDLDTLLAENEGLSGVVRALSGAEAACIAERSRILRENAKLRAVAEAEVERLRGLVRWFLDGDDCAHEDDCGARGNHDLDVCRNTKPCADETCDGPHCTCEATMMRDRARAALGEP